jgi:hypothetical protein
MRGGGASTGVGQTAPSASAGVMVRGGKVGTEHDTVQNRLKSKGQLRANTVIALGGWYVWRGVEEWIFVRTLQIQV